MTESYFFTLIFSSLILAVIVTFRAIYLRKTRDGLQQQLEQALQHLEHRDRQISSLKAIEKRFSTFKSDLQSAELTTNMQKPRLKAAFDAKNINVPERYRYIQSLASKGLAAEDIASILTLSKVETEQLLQLARLADN